MFFWIFCFFLDISRLVLDVVPGHQPHGADGPEKKIESVLFRIIKFAEEK